MIQAQKNHQGLIQDIQQFLGSNQSSFKKFAYLGMTSKVENPIRDEIALFLHNKYHNQYYIGREWNRRDLAILNKDNGEPIVIIELKNCYSMDIFSGRYKGYVEAIDSDLKKAEEFKEKDTLIYEIVFVTDIQVIIEENLKKIIKYSNFINYCMSPKLIARYH